MGDDEPNDKLKLTGEQMRSLGYRVIDLLVEHFEGMPRLRVSSRASRRALEEKLREPLPEEPAAAEELLDRVMHDVLAHMMHVDHPRFFAYVPGPNNFVGVMADALAAGFNVFAGAWAPASGPAALELVTVDWLRQICRLPDGAGGLFVSGGSMANLTALAVARHVMLGGHTENAVIYYSDQTHSSIVRALGVLGFKPEQIRRLPTGADYRLEMRELHRQVALDHAAKLRPFCVIANAGTTNTGSVDPLPEISGYCREENMWMHVDGAYGGPAMLCEQGRMQLHGIELADSLSLDPHKWLFQPFETGCVLVREARWLKETFHVQPEYLKDSEPGEEEINYRDHGIQLTRSFRALKLWMSLKTFGVEAFRRAIEHGIAMAELAEKLLRESGMWEIVTPAQLAIVSFRYTHDMLPEVAADIVTRRLVDDLLADGFALLSSTTLRGRIALRLCTINPRTTERDIRETVKRLEKFAGRYEG
jgi:glutamate/tyrosine decarboxylase-like PLP-dependent enzyme